MKSYAVFFNPTGRRRKRPVRVLDLCLGRNWGSVMRESQFLDTHLNLRRDFRGRRVRISERMSGFSAIVSADDGIWREDEELSLVLFEQSILVLASVLEIEISYSL